MKIESPQNCGNSPKNEMLKEFCIALFENDAQFISDHLDLGITWEIVGRKSIFGLKNFLAHLESSPKTRASSVTIERIISHGKEGAIEGRFNLETREAFQFSDFIEFTGAAGKKIKSITSYVIEIK